MLKYMSVYLKYMNMLMSIIKATEINVHIYSYIILLCAFVVFVLHLSFPAWPCVDHHEALVAVSNWRYFHLTEESIQGFIFPCIFHACRLIKHH